MRISRVGCLVVVLALFAFFGIVPTASAQWYQDGIKWYTRPDGNAAGNCFGNCGAGCSSKPNPCGGPRQYWSLAVVVGPNMTASGETEECVPEGDSLPRIYRVSWAEYEAIGRFTYHGYVTAGCILHDSACRSGGWAWWYCPLFLGCGSPSYTKEWSYDTWMWGLKEYRDAIGWGYYGQC